MEEKSDIWWCCFPRSTARTHLPGVRFQGFVCIVGSQHVRQISEISICNFWKWYWKNPRDWLDLPANASYPTHIQLPRALAVSNDVVKHLVKKFEKAKPWRNENEQHEEWNVRIKKSWMSIWVLRLKTMGNEFEPSLRNPLLLLQNDTQKLPNDHQDLNSSTEVRLIFLSFTHINFGWLAHHLIELSLIRSKQSKKTRWWRLENRSTTMALLCIL